MRLPFLKFAISFAITVSICLAGLSNTCTTAYIPGEAAKAVSKISGAKALTVAADIPGALRDARTSFRNALNAGVSIVACISPDAQSKSLILPHRPCS